MGLLLNKIKGFDPEDLIAQLVGHLNNCVILEKSLNLSKPIYETRLTVHTLKVIEKTK